MALAVAAHRVSCCVTPNPLLALVPAIALVLLFLLFRDPRREMSHPWRWASSARSTEKSSRLSTTDRCVVQGEAYRVRIRINAMGTYTARSPIEGRIMDLHSRVEGVGPECPANALWVESDEGASVVLQFHEYRLRDTA